MDFSRKSLLTLTGAVILAGAIIVGGIYGPTAWKVFRGQAEVPQDQVVIQTPPINYGEPQAGNNTENKGNNGDSSSTAGNINTGPQITPNSGSTTDQVGIKKYKEPDLSLLNLAPSIEDYFGEGALSDAARTLAFGAGWNIHQYVDGYLYGITAGPQDRKSVV